MTNSSRVYYSQEAADEAARERLALILLALGAGAVIALMLAPKSGQKMREDLGHGIEQGMNKAEPTIKRLEKELAELRQKVEEKVPVPHRG